MTTALTLTLFCCWLVNVNERPESNEPDEHLRVCELEIELILQFEFEDDEDDDDEDVDDVEDTVEFKFVVWLNVVLWLFVNELFIWIESELSAIDVPEIDEFKFNLNLSTAKWLFSWSIEFDFVILNCSISSISATDSFKSSTNRWRSSSFRALNMMINRSSTRLDKRIPKWWWTDVNNVT